MVDNNVEFCLEVEMEDGVKDILASPNHCKSTLLDVTVIKPKEVEAFGTNTTNTMRAEDVGQLIASLEKQRIEKRRRLNEMIQKRMKTEDTVIQVRKHKERNGKSRSPRRRDERKTSPERQLDRKKRNTEITDSMQPLLGQIRHSLRNVEKGINNMQNFGMAGSDEITVFHQKEITFSSGDTMHNQQYQTFENLKSMLVCQNKNRKTTDEKCLCENCGIIGLLTECQKKPMLIEGGGTRGAGRRPPNRNHHAAMETKETKEDDYKTRQYKFYITELSKKIKVLEERLAIQEEKAVPKDYFKKIVTKIATRITPNMLSSKNDVPDQDNNNKSRMSTVKANHNDITIENQSDRFGQNHNDKAIGTEEETTTHQMGSFWKWSGEILQPGIDLKNKIMVLLNDVLGKFSVNGKSKTAKIIFDNSYQNSSQHHYQKYMNGPTKVYTAQISNKNFPTLSDFQTTEKWINYKFPSSKSPSNLSSPKLEKTRTEKAPAARNEHAKKLINGLNEGQCKKLRLSYLNPNISTWTRDSDSQSNYETSDYDDYVKYKLGRKEFLKLLTNTLETEKESLWESIWNHAKANGQKKSDKITINIPNNKNKNSIEHTAQFTIGEIEHILTNHLKYRIKTRKK